MTTPTEKQLQSMTYIEFEQWILERKRVFHSRCDRSSKNNESVVQSLLNRYENWQDWFAGELTGYSSTTSTNKPCGIQFFATDDRQYSLNKAIAYARTAYAERTQRLSSRLVEERSQAVA
jgi:hypothetical protein